MTKDGETDFKKYATEYDPIKIGSIDGKTAFFSNYK